MSLIRKSYLHCMRKSYDQLIKQLFKQLFNQYSRLATSLSGPAIKSPFLDPWTLYRITCAFYRGTSTLRPAL